MNSKRKAAAMRKLVVLLVVAIAALPLSASRPVSVQELEQFVVDAHGKPDSDVARLLGELELTERISSARLQKLKAQVPGPKAQLALIAAADASEFLALPSQDIPDKPALDNAAQRSLLQLTMNYAAEAISRLPNFFATRNTSLFEDTPAQLPGGPKGAAIYAPLHAIGNSTVTVLYRRGREFAQAEAGKRNSHEPADHPLATAGEFGAVIATVLADASHSEVTWSHWEQGKAGPMAVFQYTIPKDASHYTVTYPDPNGDATFVPPYHGEVAVDPSNGDILRLTMVADLKTTGPVSRANLMVDYGPVEIGGITYICPVRSVALSLVQTVNVKSLQGQAWSSVGPKQLRVNDVKFSNYHLFRSEVRILSDDGTGTAAPDPQATPPPAPSAKPN
jgi:hypothetical protein